MTKLKSFFVALALFCFATASFANTPLSEIPTSTTETKELSKELATYINAIDVDALDIEVEKVHVNFIVNNNNEIVVMSTSNEAFDNTFKSVLNYKTVQATGIKKFKVYTLPVMLKKR